MLNGSSNAELGKGLEVLTDTANFGQRPCKHCVGGFLRCHGLNVASSSQCYESITHLYLQVNTSFFKLTCGHKYCEI